MIPYSELLKRAEHLKYLLDSMDKKNPDIKSAAEILNPIIKKVLDGNSDLPIALPMQTFFYRQENSLPVHVDFMNAIAKFDIGLEQLDRAINKDH